MSQTHESATLDSMFDALCHPYRRRVLLELLKQDQVKTPEFIHETVDAVSLESTTPERLKVDLHHVHLPKLASKGYIDWTPETKLVQRGPNLDEITPLIKLIDSHADKLPADWP
ncbi:DUF7344 domain-containing protein [Halobaculum limi]|uniref:DUF7344 domain-containing protein n=1 Tax=Halobaculum limi TaxID=3031916 RepID=UPI0024058031|nr:hypothetical protein [Halobaculum sp. YSMS11]